MLTDIIESVGGKGQEGILGFPDAEKKAAFSQWRSESKSSACGGRRELRGAGMQKLKLTPKQQLFVDNYCGNATDAARKAGYSYPNRQGYRLLTHVDVRAAIIERENREHQEKILTRQERQELWTRIALGLETETVLVQGKLKKVPVSMNNRLKALECLAKSQGDFMSKVEVDVGLQEELSRLSVEEIRERIKDLEDQGILEMIMNTDACFKYEGGSW